MSLNLVVKIDITKNRQLKEFLKTHNYRFYPAEYSFWRANDGVNTVTFYTNGKLLLQGKLVKKLMKDLIENNIISTAEKSYTRWIGIDESGKGDYFGALVVSGVVCDKSLEKYFLLCGVRDSKNLADSQISSIAQKIKNKLEHEVYVIMPKLYNKLYKKYKNLNTILSLAYTKVIKKLLKKCKDVKTVVIDKFATDIKIAQNFENYEIKEKIHADENDIAVAMASILARDAFLKSISMLSKNYGIKLPLGSGDKVTEVAKRFIQKYNTKKLSEIAKTHFKII